MQPHEADNSITNILRQFLKMCCLKMEVVHLVCKIAATI